MRFPSRSLGGTCQLAVTWLIHVTGNVMALAWQLLFAPFMGQTAMQGCTGAPARQNLAGVVTGAAVS
jgi:hypothetical protein